LDVVGDAEVVAFGVDGNTADDDGADGGADDVAAVVPLGVGVDGLGSVGTTPVSVVVAVGSDILDTFVGRMSVLEVSTKLPIRRYDRVGELSLMRGSGMSCRDARTDENAFRSPSPLDPGFYVEASFDREVCDVDTFRAQAGEWFVEFVVYSKGSR
jgi:hypothetical protein